MEENEEEGLKALEDGLKVDLNELKNQIEENELIYGIPSKGMSSIYIPKDPEFFRSQRRLILQRTLQVAEERPLKIQADVMLQEIKSCVQREYTSKSLPLLVHQFFVDRIQEMVVAKHAHLLRWKRYCVTTAIVESIYMDYKDRVQHIMEEYLDASSRAYRLSTTVEGILNNTDMGVDELTTDDMMIYLRWLICHLQSLKYLTQIIRVIQWFPIAHRKELFGSYEAEMQPGSEESTKTDATNKTSFTETVPPTPPLIAAAFVSAKPLKPTDFNNYLAAAGGGMVSDEKQLRLPLHTNDLEYLRPHLVVFCHTYDINMDILSIRSAADEMELFALVNRKFKTHFSMLEQMKKFKVYDASDTTGEKWGLESFLKCEKKPANWLTYIKLKPKTNINVVKYLTYLRSENKIDELIKATSKFLDMGICDNVQDALRHHALMVQHPPIVHSTSVIAHRQGINISEIFKKIYINQELFKPKYKKAADGTLDDAPDSYEFSQAMQMLGLDDSSDNKDDPSSVQGAYLSYLHLRHMKIRDLQRTCLSVLNYFRSIERTLTINDQGLSLDGRGTEKSYQNHRSSVSMDGHQGGGGNIGSHGYLYNTPREFRFSETEFMQFAEVENHDDFYFHEEGRIHVRDQAGHWIVYDVAITDMEDLKHDLMLIVSAFINKDKDLREATLIKRKRQKSDDSQSSDFDISNYSHQEVDRFGVLYDIWINHTAFMECQKKLVDIYMEAYQNTFNRDERRLLAQTITNAMYQRPRIDFETDYFVATYRMECEIMRMQAETFRTILNNQIEQQRQYLKTVGDNVLDFGIPFPVIEKLPIAVNADESALKNVYFLEFHESLSMISNISEALHWCFKETLNTCKPNSIFQELLLEKKMYEIFQQEITSLDSMGCSYALQAQRDLFATYFIENPIMITQLADDYLKSIDAKNTHGDKRSRKMKLINEFGRLFEIVTIRFRLLDATWESEVLAKIYQQQSLNLGYEEFHLYLRPIQLESAKRKENLENSRPPLYMSSIQDDENAIDKFAPSTLPLAINEIDEVGIGKFSFKGRTTVFEMLETKGVENLMVVLQVQIAHKNSLAAAVSLHNACRPSIYTVKDQESSPIQIHEKKSEKSAVESAFSSHISAPTPLALDTKMTDNYHRKDSHPEAFFSLQMEKTFCRDRTANAFLKRYSGASKPVGLELEKIKRDLVQSYAMDFASRIQQASLRAQIVSYFNSIIHILKLVPTVMTKFFQFGTQFEKKVDPDDNKTNLETDPRSLRYRSRRILSDDGSKFLNLWFIPHFTEILFLFRQLDDEKATENLRNLIKIVGSFHDILHFLVGYSRLQISSGKITSELKVEYPNSQFLTEINLASQNVGTELVEIEHQINALKEVTVENVISLLISRRNLSYLKFDYCISHILRETLLATGNDAAYQAVSQNMKFPLEELTNVQKPTYVAVKLNVPEPLEARDEKADEYFPFRALINKNGPYLIMYDFWQNLQENIQLCLAGLNDVDRPTVHGEFVSLNLCLEDMINDGDMPEAAAGNTLSINDFESVILLGKKFIKKDEKKSTHLPEDVSEDKDKNSSEKLNIISSPEKCYAIMKKYIIVSKRLDILKYFWGCMKLGLEAIGTARDFKVFSKIYKSEKLFPLMKSLCMQYRIPEAAQQGPFDDEAIFVAPKGVPELVVKQRQLGKMIESFESLIIGDIRKKIVKQIDLVIKERNREEGNLPLDLWKRPAMKETISVKRPVLAENFVQQLMSPVQLDDEAVKKSDSLTFKKSHLNECLQTLTISISQMQKETYENYAMYYENQLRHQHQMLYMKEREIEDMTLQLRQKDVATKIDVQFQLADQAHSLLLEVNALRSKIAEMREDNLQKEQTLREDIRQEYNTMIQNLFAVAFEQKNQIDVYREYLHDATLKRIQEVRSEAATEMNKIKEKSGAKSSADDELAERNLKLSKELTKLHQQNIHVRQMMSRMKSLFNWHHTFLKCNFQKSISSIEKERDRYKNSVTLIQMDSEQKVQILNEELMSLKDFLTSTERELNELRKTLDKEMKEKMDKKHAAERKAATDKQMALVKQMHIDQLMSEITEKNGNIATMSKVLTENIKSQKSVADRSVREVESLKKALREEKRLKQNAFTKVDDLISQVYEFEATFSIMKGSSPSAAGSVRPPTESSSYAQFSRPATGVTNKTGQKHLTPEIRFSSDKRKPRPITVGTHQLRRRIADQLLFNLEPDSHEQLTKTSRAV